MILTGEGREGKARAENFWLPVDAQKSRETHLAEIAPGATPRHSQLAERVVLSHLITMVPPSAWLNRHGEPNPAF